MVIQSLSDDVPAPRAAAGGAARAGAWAWPIGLSLLFALAMGIRNGGPAQLAYLLQGLHAADPSVLATDWYTTQTVPYHTLWNRFVAVLAGHGLLDAGLTAGTVLLSGGCALAHYALVRRLYDRPLLPWALSLMLFAGLFTRGLGDFTLLPTSIEPFGLAGAFAVAGLAALAGGAMVAAGLFWGLSALMHAHFSLLLAACTGLLLAWLAWQRQWRGAAGLLLPFLALAGPGLLMVAGAASVGDAQAVHAVLRRVMPQHYAPWVMGWKPVALFAGCVLFGLGGLRLRPPRPAPLLWIALLGMALMSVGGLLLGPVEALWPVSRAMPWRLSPLVMLAGLIAGCAAVVEGLAQPAARPHRRQGLALMAAGVLLLASAGTARLWLALAVVGLVALLRHVPWRSLPVRAATATAGLVLAAGAMAAFAAAEARRSNLRVAAIAGERSALYDALRGATPADAVFLVPPEWSDFRLVAQRAIVADWWAVPAYGGDVLEWYRRLQAVNGVPGPTAADQLERAYRGLDCGRVRDLAARFAVTHVVVEQGRALPCGRLLLHRDGYALLEGPFGPEVGETAP